MKLIFIASANSIHSLRWIKYFTNKKNIYIYWISLHEPNHETIDEFNKIEGKLNIYFLFKVNHFLKIIKLILSRHKSIIHIHYLGWHSLLIPLIRRNSKIILTPWGSDILKINKFKKLWIKYIIKKASYVICDSSRLKTKMIEMGTNEKKISITMFGVDTDLYKKRNRILLNKEIFIGSNRKFETVYDLKTLLYAAKKLLKFSKNIKFLLAGDGSLRNELESFVKKNNLESHIKFLGLLNKDEMINFYNSIDLYISTSLSDGGLSSSIAEAMSFERIVIAANNSDNKKWIEHEINGFIFENSNYNQLFNILQKIINEKENYTDLPEAARKIIVKNYSYNNQMNKVNLIYKEIFKNE